MISSDNSIASSPAGREALVRANRDVGSPETRANDAVFLFALFLVALAPAPIGSNRPFFWMINGILVGGAASFYCVAIRLDAARLRIAMRTLIVPGILFALSLVWMVVQIVPISGRLHSLGDYSLVWTDAAAALNRNLDSRISVDPAATVGMIVRFATYGLLFFLVVQAAASPRRARSFIVVAFWIIVAHGALAILMLELGDRLLIFPKWAYHGYATGLFVNRNSFATFVAIGIALGAVILLDLHHKNLGRPGKSASGRIEFLRSSGVYLVGVAILATAIVLSASRMGVFAATSGLVVAFAVALSRPSEGKRGLWVAAAALVLIALLVLSISGGRLVDRVGSLESHADDRLLLYEQVIAMISSRPWIGFGGGTFAEAFPSFHQLPLSADVTWDSAHNLYLELLADLGIAGLAPLLACGWLLALQVSSLRSPQVQWLAPAAAIAAASVAAVHSLADFSMQVQANALLLVVILAVGTAQSLVARRNSPEAGLAHPRSQTLPGLQA